MSQKICAELHLKSNLQLSFNVNGCQVMSCVVCVISIMLDFSNQLLPAFATLCSKWVMLASVLQADRAWMAMQITMRLSLWSCCRHPNDGLAPCSHMKCLQGTKHLLFRDGKSKNVTVFNAADPGIRPCKYESVPGQGFGQRGPRGIWVHTVDGLSLPARTTPRTPAPVTCIQVFWVTSRYWLL